MLVLRRESDYHQPPYEDRSHLYAAPPIVAAQNSGPGCSTVQNPPGIHDAAYSIGALNNGTDTIASFSSRGPVTADGSMRLKPDLSAPGTNVRSSYSSSNTSYAFLSGTSMATPHVAGAVALLWSAHPELRNDIDATENVLNSSAHHILANNCQSGPPATPNNTFGNGRLDFLAAVNQAPAFQLSGVTNGSSQVAPDASVSMNVLGGEVNADKTVDATA